MNPGGKLTIRPMTGDNVEQVHALEQECFSVPWSLNAFLGELRSPRTVYFTAYLGEELAGYAGMHHIVDEGHITNIAVAERFRGRGIASRLLEQFLRYAKNQALVLITLEVRKSNDPAIRLYRRYGFRVCGQRRDYYIKPTEDALLMTLHLEPNPNP